MRQHAHRKWSDIRALVALGLTITFAICWLELTEESNALHRLLTRLDLLYYDLRFNAMLPYTKRDNAAQRIVIIDIDERSLKEIGHWPWSRKTVASLVDHLNAAGVVSITFDVVFSEPERNIALDLADSDPAAPMANQLTAMADQFDYDKRFAASLQGHDITLGYIFHSGQPYHVGELPAPSATLAGDAIATSLVNTMQGYTASIPVLAHQAHQGFINAPPDPDGIVRRAPLFYRYGNQLYASLALQTAMTFMLQDTVTPETLDNNGDTLLQTLPLGDHRIHTDKYGQVLIPYRGGKGYYPYVSAADVLDGKADNSLLSGSIALVGTSAIGLVDLRSTPVGVSYPGTESQATIIDALLNGDVPYKPDGVSAINLISTAALGIILCIVLPLVGPLAMSTLSLGAIAALLAGNLWFWHVQKLDLPLSAEMLTVMLLYGINLAFGFFAASRQKEHIQDMFGQYVAPAHIERLLDDPAALSFTGESKTMTVLFSDIRSFTSISESLSANALKDLLNSYFTPMTEIIFRESGTIDKYVGDMIMAFWGAPLDDPDQQQHAVAAALAMQQRLHTLREEFRARGLPEIHAGIGINTGMMNVGDMGSSYRRAYTVLGDAVNLGSRLESITKFYGVDCLVSESTRAGLENTFLFREIDYIQVKGKSEAIRVYQPLCAIGDADTALLQRETLYHHARTHYLQQDWDTAEQGFQTLLAQDDVTAAKLCHLYLDRIASYRREPPPDDWRGIWRHEEK